MLQHRRSSETDMTRHMTEVNDTAATYARSVILPRRSPKRTPLLEWSCVTVSDRTYTDTLSTAPEALVAGHPHRLAVKCCSCSR
jgi:hypothetical protein